MFNILSMSLLWLLWQQLEKSKCSLLEIFFMFLLISGILLICPVINSTMVDFMSIFNAFYDYKQNVKAYFRFVKSKPRVPSPYLLLTHIFIQIISDLWQSCRCLVRSNHANALFD